MKRKEEALKPPLFVDSNNQIISFLYDNYSDLSARSLHT